MLISGFFNFDIFAIILIREVFPHPVSPINMTGTLALILNRIKINLIKLSTVKI